MYAFVIDRGGVNSRVLQRPGPEGRVARKGEGNQKWNQT